MTMSDPFFIVNTGRCGSTLLARMMRENRDWLVLSEYLSYLSSRALSRRRLDGEGYWRLLSTQSPVLREMHLAGQKQPEVLYEQGRHGPWPLHEAPAIMLATLPFLSQTPVPLYERLAAEIRPRRLAPLADHMRAVFAALADATGRRVWIERTGDSLLLTGRLAQMFPQARFVHLHRDGRDVAISMRGKPDFRAKVAYFGQLRRIGLSPYRPDFAYGVARWHEWVEAVGARFLDVRQVTDADVSLQECGLHWSWSVEAGLAELARVPPERVLTIGYEELLDDPRTTLRHLADFTGEIQPDTAWLERAAAMAAPAVSHYDRLPARDRAELDLACKTGLRLLGYV
jgi:putative sulfotransferase